MCLFITAVVPHSAQSEALAELVEKHHMSFAPCDNPHVQAQLRPSERYMYATVSHCDCGSPLFFGQKGASPQAIKRQISKLRKKKWSEAKIEKWLAATAPRPNDPNASGGDQRSIKEWAAFIDEALGLKGVPYLAVIGHWYSGSVSTDSFTLTDRVVHTVAELRAGQLGILEQDVVHEFRLDRRAGPTPPTQR